MLDFGQDKKKPVPAFSLDKGDINRARVKAKLSRVEWRLVLFMPVLLGVIAWTVYDWRMKIGEAMKGALEPIPATLVLKPMLRPSLDAMAPPPPPAEVVAARPAADAMVAAGQPPPLAADGLDAATVAWAVSRAAADRQAPPLPNRLSARELVLADHVPIGTALIIEGRLDDRLPVAMGESERPWQRLLIALDGGQYALVLAGPESADLVLGLPARVTGRLLGYADMPVDPQAVKPAAAPAGGSTTPAGPPAAAMQTVPLLLGRIVAEVRTAQASADDALGDYHRPWTMPEGIFNDVSDFRLWTETRPYYHLLGQVLRDRSTPAELDAAPDGNQAADDVHLDPEKYRGKPFQITGYVYEAWEDPDVARDQPFGVGRVVRTLLWRRDIAPVTESLNGKPERKVKQVLRLYEFAAITDQPLPERGTLLTARGRFFKKRAIAVEPDSLRDRVNNVQRQSDRVYTWLYVTDGWTELDGPPRYSFGPLGWVISGLGFIGLAIGVWWWLREVRGAGGAFDARLRASHSRRPPRPRDAAPGGTSQPGPDGQAPPPQ